jgi:hypothetical protein
MKMILKINFEKFLGRKEIETLITTQNCFKTSSLVHKYIHQYVRTEGLEFTDEHYYLIIAKLFNDSIDNLHEDTVELLTIKYQNKIEDFQNKKAIAEYLPQVKILCNEDLDTTSTQTDEMNDNSDVFTTNTEEKALSQPKKKIFKKIAEDIKKPIPKKSSSISTKSNQLEAEFIEGIKSVQAKEEYSDIEFNEEDNKLIDNIFFD